MVPAPRPGAPTGPLTMPRFDEPDYTVVAADLASRWPRFADDLSNLSTAYGARAPLPSLIEPDGAAVKPVDRPSGEPLETIAHRKIRLLSNYWHAGWPSAIPDTYLRADVNRRLGVVADKLPAPWGLAVFDGWRSLALQQELYDAAYADPSTEPDFMAPVSQDPATPPPHYSGGAVDLTLTYEGIPLALGTGFDNPTALAFTASLEARPSSERALRRILFRAMDAADFVVFAYEWWHFEFGTRRWAAITGDTPIYGASNPNEPISRS